MPCYLFTYHGYGAWLPDRSEGYVKRSVGILAPDQHMADCYRNNLLHDAVHFNATIQKVLVDAALEAFRFQPIRGHALATDDTHFHVLVSWSSERTWRTVRRMLRYSITRHLNIRIGKAHWFAKQPSRKRVRDRSHFDHLVQTYLPRHRGLKWDERRGIY